MNTNHYISNLLGAFATTVSMQIEQEIMHLGGHSLTHESALVAIRNHPNNTISILSKVLGITHSGAVRLVNTLVEEGLVERRRSNKDARAAILCVTEEGTIRVDKVLAAREKVTAQVLGHLDKQQQASIISVLETSLSALTGGQESARRICRLCDESVCRSKGCPVEMAIPQERC
ncbi:MarR family transcriptional regulator [Endozoicomonas sp. (ex Bugula neritina AB1)]|nr:MarR family transcriptional regulator [Endozoicomonas sp. (ex Bugula neritina AB1)]